MGRCDERVFVDVMKSSAERENDIDAEKHIDENTTSLLEKVLTISKKIHAVRLDVKAQSVWN